MKDEIMSDEIKIEPLTEQEILTIEERLVTNKEFDTELARAIFTIFVSGHEYNVLYKNLQAYFSASTEALNKLIGDCIEILDIKDKKKIKMMYNHADAIANKLPEIAQSKLNEIFDEEWDEIDEEDMGTK